MARVFCPRCGKRFTVTHQMIGRNGKCAECGEIFRIPEVRDDDVVALEPDEEEGRWYETPEYSAPALSRGDAEPRQSLADKYRKLPWFRKSIYMGWFAWPPMIVVGVPTCVDLFSRVVGGQGLSDVNEFIRGMCWGSLLMFPLQLLAFVGVPSAILALATGRIYYRPKPTDLQLRFWPAWNLWLFVAIGLALAFYAAAPFIDP